MVRTLSGLSWGALLLALMGPAYDIWRTVNADGWRSGWDGFIGFEFSSIGALWYGLAPGSLNLTQAVVQRYLLPELWDPVIISVLTWTPIGLFGPIAIVLILAAAFVKARSLRRSTTEGADG